MPSTFSNTGAGGIKFGGAALVKRTPPTVDRDNITFLLSGGTLNSDPTKSLGGEASQVPIRPILNNLFSDISESEAITGSVDFRCFYIKNNGRDTFYNCKIFIKDQVEGGSSILIGIETSDEVQQVAIVCANNGPTGGSFTVGFDGDPVVVTFDSNLATWAANFQTVLRNLDSLNDVEVAAQTTVTNGKKWIVFRILFTSEDGTRQQPLLEELANDLTGDTTQINIDRIRAGSPVNSIATHITDGEEVEDVDFQLYTVDDPLTIGTLKAQEVLPIWVRRETLPNTPFLGNDGVTIAIRGSAKLFA